MTQFVYTFFKQSKTAIENKKLTFFVTLSKFDYPILLFLKKRGFIKHFFFWQKCKNVYRCQIIIPNTPGLFYRWSNGHFSSDLTLCSKKKLIFLQSKGVQGILLSKNKIFLLNEIVFKNLVATPLILTRLHDVC